MFVQALSPNTHTIVNRVEKMFDHPARHRTEQLFCCAAQDKLRSICFIADCIYRQWVLSAAPWLKKKTKKKNPFDSHPNPPTALFRSFRYWLGFTHVWPQPKDVPHALLGQIM